MKLKKEKQADTGMTGQLKSRKAKFNNVYLTHFRKFYMYSDMTMVQYRRRPLQNNDAWSNFCLTKETRLIIQDALKLQGSTVKCNK